MDKRTEYTRQLSKGLNEGKNAALGVSETYKKMEGLDTTDQALLNEVYSELVALYIQSEVMLIKAYCHKKGHPSIDQSKIDTLTSDLNSVFNLSRDKTLEKLSNDEIINLLNGKMSFLDYDDFEVIDQLNRKIDPNDERMFDYIERELQASPRRMRLRQLFLNE
jgi:hypothetical protein